LPVLDPEEREEFLKEHGTEEEQKKTLEYFDTLGGAPAIVVVTMKKVRNDYNRRIGLLSCGMATQNLMLAAASLGLVTCCVGSTMWIEDSILQAMNRPDDEFVTLLSLGYPDEEEDMTKRKFNVVDWIGS
jgi:nitroreductase